MRLETLFGKKRTRIFSFFFFGKNDKKKSQWGGFSAPVRLKLKR